MTVMPQSEDDNATLNTADSLANRSSQKQIEFETFAESNPKFRESINHFLALRYSLVPDSIYIHSSTDIATALAEDAKQLAIMNRIGVASIRLTRVIPEISSNPIEIGFIYTGVSKLLIGVERVAPQSVGMGTNEFFQPGAILQLHALNHLNGIPTIAIADVSQLKITGVGGSSPESDAFFRDPSLIKQKVIGLGAMGTLMNLYKFLVKDKSGASRTVEEAVTQLNNELFTYLKKQAGS